MILRQLQSLTRKHKIECRGQTTIGEQMPSAVFQALSKQKVDSFCSSFKTIAKELFQDDSSHTLRHPAEFGAYRERACADFLRLFLPTYLSIGSGFLINKNDQISTQCDLVIYDPQYTPLVEDAEKRRFFPVETVAAIGEVKSSLSKQDLLNALVKLAIAKQLRIIDGSACPVRRASGLIFGDIGHHFDQMISFLICEKLSFNLDNLTADLTSCYDAANIPVWARHNLVLSLQDGILCYKNHLLEKEGGTTVLWMYPWVLNERMKNRFLFPGDSGRNHLAVFTAYLFLLCSHATIYLPHIADYDTPQSMGRYQDEN